MQLVIGIVYFVIHTHKCRCSLFDNTRMDSLRDGNILVTLADPIINSKSLEIRFNLQDVDSTSQHRPVRRQSKVFATEDCSLAAKQHCRRTKNGISLIAQPGNAHCLFFNYSSTGGALTATLNIGGIHLYGGSEHFNVKWPVDKQKYVRNSYVTTSHFFQAILEPYWLMSTGYYIYVDDAVPLFVSRDPDTSDFELTAENDFPYRKDRTTALNFVVCKLRDIKMAHEHAVKHVLGTPDSMPDLTRVRYPIWSTWVRYQDHIDEQRVLHYAEEIRRHGYGGQLQIDDNWERCYGSFEPNQRRFPDLRWLVDRLKRHFLFVGVNLWLHPFVNADCEPTYSTGVKRGYFARDVANRHTTQWWRGANASVVDFTNPQAAEWFRERVLELRRRYGVDSFKFDGGESVYAPQPTNLRRPEAIVKAYVGVIASLGTNVHTRVGRGTQRHPVYVTMMDRDSTWRRPLGLVTVVPQLLQLNVLGYSFVMADMIGGNRLSAEPTGELFIRYLQANVFMPSMQFSVPPWDFGPTYVTLAKKFIDLRSRYVDRIINLMRKNVVTGTPVNPPIWWIAPHDEEALICDSEFLLGEDLLVAPVLEEGKISRDVYLPHGVWRDENHRYRELIKGPTWLRDYAADLSVLPYFTRELVEDGGSNLAVMDGTTSAYDSFTLSYVLLAISTAAVMLVLCCRYWRLGRRLSCWQSCL